MALHRFANPSPLPALAIFLAVYGARLHGVPPAVAEPAVSVVTDSLIVVGGDTLFVVAPVEVAGDRVAVALPGALRPVAVQDLDGVSARPLRAAADALAGNPSVVVGQRQAWGVQTDLSIRGSTFEQVQVLLDGVDISDPQTGHHALDLPLALHDIARLEILPGHGSVLLGSGALAGVVNIVPAAPTRGASGSLGALGGPDGTWAVRGEATLPLSDDLPSGVDPRSPIAGHGRSLRVSAERFRTDGHEIDGVWSGRDADLATATVRYLDASPGRRTDVFVGWADRRFGAQDFYTPTRGYEETRTVVVTARHRKQLGQVVLEPRLAGRRHRDRFTLWRDEPDRYRNDHLTRRLVAGLRASAPLASDWVLAADVAGVYADIDSDGVRGGVPGEALGEHARRHAGLALELARTGARWRAQAGSRLTARDGQVPRADVTGAVAWQPRPDWTLHAAAGSVHRVPSFTELHYEDPYNRADPDLAPETAWSWDAGLRHAGGRWSAAATYFERHEEDVIDWARAPGDTFWVVQNAAQGRVRGVELQLGWRGGRGHAATLGYQYLDKHLALAVGTEAKYALVIPRHHVAGAATAVLGAGLDLTVTGRWLEHTGGGPEFATWAVFAARLRWRSGPWTVTLDGQNLGDRRYAEIPGAVMSGRIVLAGVERAF